MNSKEQGLVLLCIKDEIVASQIKGSLSDYGFGVTQCFSDRNLHKYPDNNNEIITVILDRNFTELNSKNNIRDIFGKIPVIFVYDRSENDILELSGRGFSCYYDKNSGETALILAVISVSSGSRKNLTVSDTSIYEKREDRDICEKIKKLENEKRLLLNETNYRVKNNMNLIYSLLSLEAAKINNNTAKEILTHAAERILLMSSLYNKLYQTGNIYNPDLNCFLPPLIDEIISIFPNSSNIKYELTIDDIVLKPKQLSPVGIILNELLSYSIKYSFIDTEEGFIRIIFKKNGKEICMEYEDNGKGIPSVSTVNDSVQFGLHLVKLLVEQIKGNINISNNPNTYLTINFPV